MRSHVSTVAGRASRVFAPLVLLGFLLAISLVPSVTRAQVDRDHAVWVGATQEPAS